NPNVSKQNIAEQFDIQLVQLHKWVKNKEQLISSSPHIRRLNIRRHVKYPILETDLRKCYNKWMMNEILNLTSSGYIQHPSYSQVANWVKAAWDQVNFALIVWAFKCCGVTVARDGLEEDKIFNYDLIQDVDNDEDYNESFDINLDINTDQENQDQ
ncbi:1523_t:CDS:2, partial [Cetraspora pellucida]